MQSRQMCLSVLLLLGCGEGSGEGLTPVGGRQSNLYVASSKIWNTSNISVCWENANSGNAQERGWIQNAIRDSWQRVSTMTFTGWGACTSGATGLRVLLQNAGGFTTGLGTDLNGVQNGVNLNMWGSAGSPTFCASGFTREDCVASTGVHEFGHALGFAHEQNRTDTPSSCNQPQGSNGDVTVGSWDLNSVMNWCNPVRNGKGILSSTDMVGVQGYYGPRQTQAGAFTLNLGVYQAYGDLSGLSSSYASFHWYNYGIHEGRISSYTFDAPYYLTSHSDLVAAFGSVDYAAALNHYVTQGLYEGRAGSTTFDPVYYLAQNPDIAAAYGATNYAGALSHFAQQGLPIEGRRGSAQFSVSFYLSHYPDIAAAYGATNYAAATRHWLLTGRGEGRIGAP